MLLQRTLVLWAARLERSPHRVCSSGGRSKQYPPGAGQDASFSTDDIPPG